jgi:ribosome-binding factor A
MSVSYRPERVAHELKVEIGDIIARQLHDPRVGFATITDARVSPDLRHARIYVSVFGTPQQQQETIAALNHAAGFIRRALGSRLRLRRSPELTFTFDQSVEYGDRMARLIEEVNKETSDSRAQTSDPEDDSSEPEV